MIQPSPNTTNSEIEHDFMQTKQNVDMILDHDVYNNLNILW